MSKWTEMIDKNEIKEFPNKNNIHQKINKHKYIYRCCMCMKEFYNSDVFFKHLYRDHTKAELKKFKASII